MFTFFCVIAFSVCLPLKMDEKITWDWQETFLPLYCMFAVPLIMLFILFPIIGWLPLKHGMVKPFNSWLWWLDFFNYVIGGPAFLIMLGRRLDGNSLLDYKIVFIPLFVTVGCSIIANLARKEIAEFVRDAGISISFLVLTLFKLQGKTPDRTWWEVFTPIFVADGFFCLYMLTRPNPRFNRSLIFIGSLVFLIPLIVFQYAAVAHLEDMNKYTWCEIWIPVWVAEGMTFIPLCCILARIGAVTALDAYKKKTIDGYMKVGKDAVGLGKTGSAHNRHLEVETGGNDYYVRPNTSNAYQYEADKTQKSALGQVAAVGVATASGQMGFADGIASVVDNTALHEQMKEQFEAMVHPADPDPQLAQRTPGARTQADDRSL